MVMFMSSVLYGAVIALSAVTNLSFEMCVIFVGLCCAFYCSIGGLKAVLWTDVFQACLMLACIATVCIAGIGDIGGISNIFKIASAGKRLKIFDMSMDLTRRYTFWNCFLRGIWGGLAYFGAGQAEVQRMLSMRNAERGQSVLRLSVLPIMCLHLLCDFIGLILYAVYQSCDPLLNKNNTGLTKYDQIVPYYIVTRVGAIPGLTGLCIAGIFSGSLSTISSVLNSLATVTVVDFLQPFFPTYFNDKKSLFMAKFLTAMYGIICIFCALSLKSVESLKQTTTIFLSTMEGPMVAIFLIAVLTRKVTDKCISFGFLVGFILMVWIGLGSMMSGYIEPTLSLHANNCSTILSSLNPTVSAFRTNESLTAINSSKDFGETMFIYKISFYWLPMVGTVLTLTTTFFAVIVTGWKINAIPSDSKCLSPVTRFRKRKSGTTNNKAHATVCQLQQITGFSVEEKLGHKKWKDFSTM